MIYSQHGCLRRIETFWKLWERLLVFISNRQTSVKPRVQIRYGAHQESEIAQENDERRIFHML